MITAEDLAELGLACAGQPVEMTEGGQVFIHLPALKVPNGGSMDALLALTAHSGYPTRLFLTAQVTGKGQNWNQFHILGKTWHSWSWNFVTADRRPMDILAEHLRGLR